MISQKNAIATIGLAKHFAGKGQAVCPKPHTVLSECVRYTNLTDSRLIPAETGLDEKHIFEMAAFNLEIVSTGTEKTPSEHDAYMDQVSESIAKAVLGHVNFARNIVKPVILEVGEKIHQSLYKQSSVIKLQDKVQIVQLDVPELVGDASFMNELEMYKHKPIVEPSIVAGHACKTKDQILPLILTGSQDTDEKIINWYSNLDEKWVNSVWTKYFSKEPGITVLNLSLFNKLNLGILLYLLGSKLMEDVTHNETPMSLPAYKQAMADLKEHGGRLTISSLSMIRSFDKTKRVVVETSNLSGYCHVYAPNYQTWLKAGGSPEAILGLVVSNSTSAFHTPLLEEKASLEKAWSSYVSFSNTDSALKKFDEFKSNVILAVRDSYTHVSDLEKKAWADIPNFEQTAAKILEDEVEDLRAADMQMPYDVALRAVCRSRFFYTSAEKILSGIEAVIEENDKIEPREAATISVIMYVADYMADQMTLTT